ncbi:MAG: hypothetical protein KBF25_03130 [Chitinophagaceae bacterium]|jgi:hypothetical protein|nr:hypothetical protein [Bacteroidota bacterium]MBP9932659.1 hypothetical protein [Chitinophagaceae bacterium]
MALKFFLMYIAGCFAGAVALLAFVKKMSSRLGAAGSKPIIYSVVLSLISGLLMFGLSFLISNLFVLFWIFLGLVLLIGILHWNWTHQKYFVEKGVSENKLRAAEFLFALEVVLFTTVVFSALQYFILDQSFLFYPVLLVMLAMFIPLLFVHTFDLAAQIPPSEYPVWIYPNQRIEVPEDNPNERLLVIGFMIGKKNTETKKTYFRAKTPENIKLGELFYHFINDYNDLQSETPIEYLDAYQEPVEWWFRRKPKWYQFQRILDPALTMQQNGVRENTVIICERILSA